MTAPQHTGSAPAAWGLEAPLPATRSVPVHGAPGQELFYVRSPVTGDVRGVSLPEAESLIFRSGWEPVTEPGAVRLLENQIMRQRASPASALLYGAARGVSGGLAEFMLPQGEEPGARALDAVREEYPGTALAGEVAGSLLPLSRVAGAARYASPVALAEAAGQRATTALAGSAPGLGRSILARTAGTALEGGVIGTTYEAGNTRIEDSPLTAQKLASGFFAGALPGAIIGAPVGAVEGALGSLGQRFAQRGEALRKEINTAGVSDADLMKIAHREFGVPVPGLSEELQAAIARDPNLSPDFYALAKDSGRVGKVVRNELIDAPALRAQAEAKAAAGMNAIQELDEQAIQGWIHGKPKKDLIKQWLAEAPPEVDVDAAIAAARRVQDELTTPDSGAPRRATAINDLARAMGEAAEQDGAFRSELGARLGVRPDRAELENAVAGGLARRDDNVSAALSDLLKAASPQARARFDAAARRLLPQSPELQQWRARSAGMVDQLGAEADALMNLSPGVLGQPKAEARKVRDLFANARARVASGDRADGFAALDELKARLGPHAKPDAWLGQDDNVAKFVRRAYEDIRTTLEDEALWGPRAAAAQREMNQLFHQRLARSDGYFKQFFEDAGAPHPRNPWVNQRLATPERVRSALKGITNPNEARQLDLFRAHIAETRDVADKMRRYYNLSPEGDQAVQKLLAGVDDAERGLNEAVTYSMREAQANALFNNRGNAVPGWAKWAAWGFVGPLGFAAVKLAENIANPGQKIYMRAVLERVMRGSESRTANAILGLVSGKKPLGFRSATTQLAARASASILDERDPEKTAKEYASSLAELTKLTDPVAAAHAIKGSAPFISETLPRATAHAGIMFSRAAQYVLSKAPVQPRFGPNGIEVSVPSESELEEWERIYAGAFDPLSAIEDAAEGHGSLEAMRAAEATAPELVQEIRELVLEELPYHDVPYNRVIDISIVLGVPLDATMEPDYINAQQLMHASRFKDSETQKSRRSYGEDGVNEGYKPGQSAADRVEADIPPE